MGTGLLIIATSGEGAFNCSSTEIRQGIPYRGMSFMEGKVRHKCDGYNIMHMKMTVRFI